MQKTSVGVNLDLEGNEIQNVKGQNLANMPADVRESQFWYDTVEHTFKFYNGENAVDMGSQGRIYSGGDGIDINGTEISVDNTVAKKTDLPTVNNATLTIQRNGTDVQTFTANANTNVTANILVPTNAGDVNALPSSTKYGYTIDLNLNETDYKLTITLKDQDGNVLSSKVVDFPVESVVVSGSYDATNQKIVLTLQNGTTVDIPVGALVAGLQSEITSSNKLSSDLVDDTNNANKFVTSAQRTQIGTNTSDIADIKTELTTVTKKITAANPTLSPSGGVCTWTITNTLETADVDIRVYFASTGEKYIVNSAATSSTITIKINSENTITAGTYKAVIIG
ncbi:MAG: hypothetical protein J6W96_04890 [Alphaproteobacteria bacterium]|nr:hypothetical protein [Alphaproteobacteria bacterium]